MKKFKLQIDQNELNLLVRHLNKGIYEEVAQFLFNLQSQVNAQLPKPKTDKKAEALIKSTNGAARYAKGL